MSDTAQARRRSSRKPVLAVLAVSVGAALAWLALLGAFYLPTDRPAVWFGVPMVVVAAVAFSATKRSRWLGVSLAAGGLLALGFFVWLLWQFGQGMQNFD